MEELLVKWGLETVTKLTTEYKRISRAHREELNHIGDNFGPADELATYYVEPDCQSINPSDTDEDGRSAVPRGPVLRHIGEFIQRPVPQRDGSSNQFILADAGMGKTSLLVMLKLLHLGSFWPQRYDCVLMKLGYDTLEKVSKLDNKSNTVLLLDSLDEDQTIGASHKSIARRVIELLENTQSFRRTVITCRTQFFPIDRGDVFERDGWIQVGGYRCPAAYLSLFDEEQIEVYLTKRYPRSFLRWLLRRNHPKREKASALVALMRSLKARPMLLSYIDDLLCSKRKFESEYDMYETLVETWLMREERKLSTMLPQSSVTRDQLRKGVTALAFCGQLENARYFSRDDLRVFSKYAGIEIDQIDLGGRSILSVTSERRYRFAHFSLQEFLVANLIACNPNLVGELLSLFESNPLLDLHRPTERAIPTKTTSSVPPDQKPKARAPHWTPLLTRFVLQRKQFEAAYLSQSDFTNASLSGENLRRADLRGSHFRNADLSRAVLDHANLELANLRNARLQSASCVNANLSGADLCFANLENARMANANLGRVQAGPSSRELRELEDLVAALTRRGRPDFGTASVDEDKLRKSRANFRSAELPRAVLDEANLCCAIFDNCVLLEASCAGADFYRASLRGAIMTRANLEGANLEGANLEGANLEGANLEGANLEGANLEGANLEGAKFLGVAPP